MSGDIQTQSVYSAASVAVSGGTIDGSVIGGTTPAAGTFTTLLTNTNLRAATTDTSGTPGNATINTPSGRCAIAAAATTVVITSSIVTAASKVFAIINQAAVDTTLKQITQVATTAGSFTITGNAAATAAVKVDFLVVN